MPQEMPTNAGGSATRNLIARVAMVFVSVVIYFGLAVLGGGGPTVFFSHTALIARIHSEERLLREQFGEEYDAFCVRTSRLIPGIY